MFRKFYVAAFASGVIFAPHAEACTGIRLIAVDGGVVPGRTLEFGFDLKSDVIVIPKGTTIVGSTPNGSHGIYYTTNMGCSAPTRWVCLSSSMASMIRAFTSAFSIFPATPLIRMRARKCCARDGTA